MSRPSPAAQPQTYDCLVTSISPTGVPVSTRHHSAESAVSELIHRHTSGHQEAKITLAPPIAPLPINAVTKRRTSAPLPGRRQQQAVQR